MVQLHNHTNMAAELLRGSSPRGTDNMLACVIARATFRVSGAQLEATPEDPWPIGREPDETPLGLRLGDEGAYMGGVDVLLGGVVHASQRGRRSRIDVELAVGRTFRRRIAVFGDRRWVRGPGSELVASEPEPYLSMPLTYDRAYGGSANTEYGATMPCLDNPQGKGFYLSRDDAEGQPLPNLEWAGELLGGPLDQPTPVGLGYYSREGALRPRMSIDHPATKTAPPELPTQPNLVPLSTSQVSPRVLNMAHPRMIIDAANAPKTGDRIRLTHGLRDGDLEAFMPDFACHLYVQLEDREHTIPMHLDQVGIVAGEGQIMLGMRSVFEYTVNRFERRHVALHAGPCPPQAPARYRIPLGARRGA